MHDLDVGRGDADLLGHELRERRLVALPLGLAGQSDDGLAGRVHAELGAVTHAEAEDVHVLARPGTNRLGEERNADTHQLAARAPLGLLTRSSSYSAIRMASRIVGS